MDLKLLRSATRPEHEATEAVVPLMSPDLSREEYVAVLQRFADVVCAWDAFAETAAPEHLRGLVAARRRRASIAQDLHFFGIAPEEQPSLTLQRQMHSLVLNDLRLHPSRFLGAMYVLEGSTLGGRYIAAHVEQVLGLEPGQGDRFFRGYEDQTMPMWREFQQALVAVPDDEGAAVIDAARQMFGVFQRAMGTAHLANMEHSRAEHGTPAG